MNHSTDFEILTTAFAGPEAAFDRKLRYRFWELLAQTGTPVSLDALTQALGCERWQGMGKSAQPWIDTHV